MKQAAALLACANALTTAQSDIVGVPIEDLTTLQYNAIIAGIAWGFIQKEGLTEIEKCILDGKAEAVLAFHAFEDAIHKDFTKAAAEGVAALKGLPGLVSDCTGISDDIATLEAVIANLEA